MQKQRKWTKTVEVAGEKKPKQLDEWKIIYVEHRLVRFAHTLHSVR